MLSWKNLDGRSFQEFDDVSIQAVVNASDDSPIWDGYPYTQDQKGFSRVLAKYILKERSAGRMISGTLRAINIP